MKALKALSGKRAEIRDGLPVPALRPDYVTIKIKAVALNPTDWKHIQFVDQECTVGCDFAGVVEEVGSAVTKPWKKGDRVCGFMHGSNEIHGEDGAFGEYGTGKGDLLIRIPDSMSFEDAATLGVGVVTVGQGLYQEMELPLPDGSQGSADGKPILIYGGSTATGMAAIQFAKLSGFTVITTCSPRNFDKVRSFGADHVFDYNSPTCAADIRKLTNNNLQYAWDTISEGSSPKICAEALGDSGDLKYGTTLPVEDFPRKHVKQTSSVGYTVIGERFQWRTTYFEARPQDYEFGVTFTSIAEKLLADRKIRPPSKEVRDGGLDAIFGGLDDLKEGRVSGTKIVYRIGGQ